MASTINASTTLGLISSADTSGVLQLQTANTAAVTIDASQNVGIGTSSPAYKLDVTSASDASLLQIKSTASANNTAMRFGIDGNNSFINASGGSTGVLQLRVFGTTKATLDTSGNLGLGVTPSAWGSIFKAQQIGSYGAFVAGRSDGSNQVHVGVNAYFNGSNWIYANTSTASRYYQSSGVHYWENAASGTAGNAITFTQAMTLDSGGNLLVGTTSSGWTASNRNIIHVAGTSSSLIGIGSNSSTGTYLYTDNTDAILSNNATGSLRLNTSGTERARIDSSGNLLVGTTGATGKITVSTSGNTYGIYSENTNTATTSNYLFWGYASSASRFVVYGNGGIANYQANNVNLSDRREKTNFAPAKSYLDVICAIPVQTFNFIDQAENDVGLTLGVIAQDVQAVAPELVTENNWGTEEEPKMRLSIYQTDLQYALMKCIQEQQAIIESLKARLDAANL